MAHSAPPSGRREMTIVGDHPRLHNGGQKGGSHAATHYMQRKKHRCRARSSSPMGRVILINAPVDGGGDSEDIHTVTVDKSPDGRLGFSVRGGSEHGLGIFVSKVEDDSSAEKAGLSVGDKLVEVNGISLESITMSSAVKVLTGSNRLRMVLRRVGKVPGIRYSKEKTTWVDLIHRRMVVEESGRTPSEASSDSALRRIVHLFTTSDDYCLGFNIRGGKEFGLGIYVSKMDPGGLAEQHGIKMGDQILAANGVSFDDITHSNAVEVLKSHTHVMLTIREAGRYPAYKEMVAEYSWLNKLANGGPASSSQGSESFSSASSLSSGTPASSLSGLSHVLFPPVFGSDMPDVAIATGDNFRRPGGAQRTTETAIQTDPLPSTLYPTKNPSPHVSRGPSAPETSRTVGATVLLKDTLIHGKGEGPRESRVAGEVSRRRTRTLSSGDQEVAKDSPKTAALMALSRPRKPIGRSQSHITANEDKQKKKAQQKKKSPAEGRTSLQRSKTFVNLLFRRDRKDKSRSKSPSHHADREKSHPFLLLTSPRESSAGVKDNCPVALAGALQQVESMAQRLLSQDEVTAVLRHCRRFLSDNELGNLVRPLLAILDRPEKLLLLREIRMLIPTTVRGHFDGMVMPFELEAYRILRTRSGRSPALRSPRSGTPRRHLITPIPDYRGGFQLQPVQDVARARQLVEDLESLRTSGLEACCLLPTSRAFPPLLDVPIDGCSSYATRSRSPSPSPNFLHAERPRDSLTLRYDEASLGSASDRGESTPERGRSPARYGPRSRTRRETSPDSMDGRRRRQEGYTELRVQVPAHRLGARRPLGETAKPLGERNPSTGKENDPRGGGHSQNGHRGRRKSTHLTEEDQITTISISKTRPSLGISISGGVESRVQPMVKIEKIFPGGTASTSELLKAGYELVSVDGESLQGVTHQHAVDVIRRTFSDKAKDTIVFVVKVPKVTTTTPSGAMGPTN